MSLPKQQIQKYQFEDGNVSMTLELPEGSRLLKVGEQGGLITTWWLVPIEVNLDQVFKERVDLIFFGTGAAGKHFHDLFYLDTVQERILGKEFVWHVFANREGCRDEL